MNVDIYDYFPEIYYIILLINQMKLARSKQY